jgi:hypothetical protein
LLKLTARMAGTNSRKLGGLKDKNRTYLQIFLNYGWTAGWFLKTLRTKLQKAHG